MTKFDQSAMAKPVSSAARAAVSSSSILLTNYLEVYKAQRKNLDFIILFLSIVFDLDDFFIDTQEENLVSSCDFV